jgi:formylglycine-generating enzyme required for sulfatase activity
LGLVDIGAGPDGGVGAGPNGGPAFETGWDVSYDAYVAPTDAHLACEPPPASNVWTASAGPNENLPIDCVNWFEAYAFCIWDGGFLPSDTEYEFAEVGGNEQRYLPRGSPKSGQA